MNYLGLTVFAGNTPGLILDFDSATKEYTVEFTDGRVVKTASVFWDKTIPSEPDIAFYRQSSVGNGEQLVYDPEIGWDIVSFVDEKPIDIVNEPSKLDEWVDDYKEEDKQESDHSNIEDKLNEVLETLQELVQKDEAVHEKMDGEDDSAVQQQDHDATEDSYWDRSTKPNPMAYDEEFPSGNYNERNPGTLNPTAKTAKDCGCWEGYKRVPGTEPCAPGSCEKCDAARKKESAAKKKNTDEAVKKVNTVPPSGVRAAAKRGLKYYEEGKAGDGFEAATAARARKIAAGEALTEEHINRMHSFFERHAGGRSKKAKPGEVTAWDVAWLCWGGDAGRSWAAKVDAQLHKARHPDSKKKHSADAGAGVLPKEERNEDEIVLREPSGSDPQRLLQKTRDLMTSDGQDYDGNPDQEFGEGGDEGETHLDRHVVHLQDADLDDVDAPLVADFGEYKDEDEEYKRHSSVRSEIEWEEKHFSKSVTCPNCSDPLINYNCYACGDNHKKYAKAIEKKNKKINKIAKSLEGQVEQLGILFGEALAGHRRDAVTAPSEGIFAIEIHGVDSNPEHGGTGNYNAQHGDSPELGKDVNHGGGGWIDATPEDDELEATAEDFGDAVEMVILYADSDKSGEDEKEIKKAEKMLSNLFGEDFDRPKEEAKNKKNSSLKIAVGNPCKACGRYYINNVCNVSGSSNEDVAPEGCDAVGGRNDIGTANTQGGQSIQNKQTMPMGDVGHSSVSSGWSTNGNPNFQISPRRSALEQALDSDGEPLREGETYSVYTEAGDTPDVITVKSVDQDSVTYSRSDLDIAGGPSSTETMPIEQIEAEGMSFDKRDIVNPVEINRDSVPATDGTPETMDDAGPGHNDIPGVRDLSNAHEASVKEAGRHYMPYQQKEFINETGSARNLDKLVLEGTHYVDNNVTSSDNFDDDFLFGV